MSLIDTESIGDTPLGSGGDQIESLNLEIEGTGSFEPVISGTGSTETEEVTE